MQDLLIAFAFLFMLVTPAIVASQFESNETDVESY